MHAVWGGLLCSACCKYRIACVRISLLIRACLRFISYILGYSELSVSICISLSHVNVVLWNSQSIVQKSYSLIFIDWLVIDHLS